MSKTGNVRADVTARKRTNVRDCGASAASGKTTVEDAKLFRAGVHDMMTSFRYGLGWVPDLPDIRDYTHENETVHGLLKQTAAKKTVLGAKKPALPKSVDLREWCPPIEDQGQLGSCTANAAVGLVEYYERRAAGDHVDASRLFVYKATRNLLGWTGDTGAYLRTAMQALVCFGAPPESYWRYDVARYEEEPTAFLYALASNYKALQYYRLDVPGEAASGTLEHIKQYLAAGLPSMFGFTVYDSLADGPDIPFPRPGDRVAGGHAVVAVGYDNARKIGGKTGALLIRNSWGRGWGDEGYGWLPYDYVTQGLADDFWSVLQQSWVDTHQFD